MNLCLQEQFVVPRGGNLTYNGDPRVGKLTFENLKMSNFPWVARPPILGQTIDRCITLYTRHDNCFKGKK